MEPKWVMYRFCCKTDVFETGLYPCHWGGLSLWCKRQKWFSLVLETGIRNGNFRNELHSLLKNSTITDEELLGCVTFAGSNESEWSEKFSNKKKSGTSIFDEQHQKWQSSPFANSATWTGP